MIYLSGCITGIVDVLHRRLGFILVPGTGWIDEIANHIPVAFDNGCFSDPDGYSDEKYMRFLRNNRFDQTLFATAPDVLGDHMATVRRSLPVLDMIRNIGLPSAFVAQDGWDETSTPWDCMDAIFIGGSTEFKFRGGREAVRAAKRRGLWAHMGRVNSLDRLRAAVSIGCDSADGTFLRFGPDVNAPRLLGWLDKIDMQSEMML